MKTMTNCQVLMTKQSKGYLCPRDENYSFLELATTQEEEEEAMVITTTRDRITTEGVVATTTEEGTILGIGQEEVVPTVDFLHEDGGIPAVEDILVIEEEEEVIQAVPAILITDHHMAVDTIEDLLLVMGLDRAVEDSGSVAVAVKEEEAMEMDMDMGTAMEVEDQATEVVEVEATGHLHLNTIGPQQDQGRLARISTGVRTATTLDTVTLMTTTWVMAKVEEGWGILVPAAVREAMDSIRMHLRTTTDPIKERQRTVMHQPRICHRTCRHTRTQKVTKERDLSPLSRLLRRFPSHNLFGK